MPIDLAASATLIDVLVTNPKGFFELALFTPLGEAQKFTIVQCSTCGTPIGALDPALGLQIEAPKHQVAAIDERLNRIATALQR